MRVKIEFIKDDAEKDLTASVETQHKRGDSFTIHQANLLMNGEGGTFTVPSSGRLVINMPTATEKPVYDREQGAAVLASAQTQATEGADKPDPREIIRMKEAELQQLKEEDAARRDRENAEQAAKEEAAAADERRRSEAAKTQASLDEKNKNISNSTPRATSSIPSGRTPPQGGQPLTAQPNSAPVASNESPNSKSSQTSPTPGAAQPGLTQSGGTVKTTTTPSTTPAHGGAPQGGSTEKK